MHLQSCLHPPDQWILGRQLRALCQDLLLKARNDQFVKLRSLKIGSLNRRRVYLECGDELGVGPDRVEARIDEAEK